MPRVTIKSLPSSKITTLLVRANIKIATKPQPKSAIISFTPNKQATKVSMPKIASSVVFTAFLPNRKAAIIMIAITAGFIP